jgi:16S rRNA (guanine966-N2)-methyltransferase
MIRITGGKLRGRGVESPPRSKEIRPTTALIRESIFSSLQQRIPGCRFLDLFAGSGIMGIEAISRGADFVLAVDKDARQCQVIRKSYAALGVTQEQGKIIPHDAVALISKPCREEGFDVIFVDPPYGFAKLPAVIEALIANGWVKPEGVIIAEHGSRDPDLSGFTRRDYGDTSVSTRILDR